MKSQFKLFKTRRFLPLFIIQFLGAFNDNLFKNALLVFVTYGGILANEKSINLAINLAAALFILPFFLFSATAGKLADKYDKIQLIKWIKLIEIILMCLSVYFFITQNIIGLFFLLFFLGLQSAFFGPIKYSLLPIQLNKDELISGNGFFEAGTFLAILLGTISGTILYQSHPEYGPISVITILVIFSIAGFYTSYRMTPTQQSNPKIKVSFNFVKDTFILIKETKKNHTIWLIIFAISWFFLIGIAFLSQFPSYTKQIINGNEYVLMLFLTLFSIGVGIGSLTYHMFSKGRVNPRLIQISIIGMSFFITLFVICSYYYAIANTTNTENHELYSIMYFLNMTSWAYGICLSLFLLATSSGIYIVPLYTLLQQLADKDKLAQIIACNNIINAIFMTVVSIIIIGLILASLSLNSIFLLLALANLFFIKLVYKIEHSDQLNSN